MGGCCGAMKTGQKSLPDKKKSPAEGNQEKSNGKETVAQAVPATETNKAPEQAVEHDQRIEDVEAQKQEFIVAPVKVSVNAAHPSAGIEVPSTGTENVMDLETAVAPFEGVISNVQAQLETQGPVASTDSEFLLPYQIPVQHTFTNITTTTTKQQDFETDFNLRMDEPLLEAAFPGDVQLSITENFQSSSIKETEVSPPSGAVEVETVTKVTGPAATETIPSVPEITADGNVEISAESSGEVNIDEPVAAVLTSFSHEAPEPQEELLPTVNLVQSHQLTEEISPEAEISMPAATSESDAAPEPEPILMICPPRYDINIPPPDSHNIAVCPPLPDSPFTITEIEKHAPEDLGQVVVSESVENKTEVPHEEATPSITASLPEKQVAPIDLSAENNLVEEPATLVQVPEQPFVDEKISAYAPFEEPLTAVRSFDPVPELLPTMIIEDLLPPVAQEQTVCAPFEEPLTAVKSIDPVPDFTPTIDILPPVAQEQTEEPWEPVPTLDERIAICIEPPQEEVCVEGAEEKLAAVESEENLTESSLLSEEKNVAGDDVSDASFQLEECLAAEPIPYQDKQSEEAECHEEVDHQEPQPYQEQQPTEAASYQEPSTAELIEQVPVSVSEVPDESQTSENIDATPVLELVSEQTQESRENWWKESGQAGIDSQVPVLELLSDPALEARQAWWEQNGSESVPDAAEPAPVSSEGDLPPVPLQQEFAADASTPADDASIPPPEEAVISAIPAEIEELSPSSDSFPEVIPEPLLSTYDQGVSDKTSFVPVESPLSNDESTIPTENGEVSQSSDDAYTPASVVSSEGSTPASTLSPAEGVDPAASSKEPISTQA